MNSPKDITVVTSCSLEGWNKYGAKCVASFCAFWPKTVQLIVVSEDRLPDDINVGNVLVAPMPETPFLKKYAEEKWAHGASSSPRPEGIAPQWVSTSGYAFRNDAYKFSKKIFAIQRAAKITAGGKLIWIDADTVTFAPVDMSLFDYAVPDQFAISCLQRPGYHSECGFVGYNLEHPRTRPFINNFARLYNTGEVFKLREWHDSWVFDWLRLKEKVPTYAIPHHSQSHPFINSVLGKYMDHLKGARKERGRSLPNEQIKHKGLEYWK